MFYRVLSRILRRHAPFHLLIPLFIGVAVEALYANVYDKTPWSSIPKHLLSGHQIALYLGIVIAYFVVIGALIRTETAISLKRIDLNALAGTLRGMESLFVVSTTPFDEWFDPAAQVYLAVIFGERLKHPFRYERVLLLPSRSAKRNLNSPYLDGFHAQCLLDIHLALGIELYFLWWEDITEIIHKLTRKERVLIGYYSPMVGRLPHWLARVVMWPMKRRRVRGIAGGLMTDGTGALSVFRFAKHENVVDVEVQPQERAEAYMRFVTLIKERLYKPNTETVDTSHDFTIYYRYASGQRK
jgi:hypothetical protein